MQLTDTQLHAMANASRELNKIAGPLRTAVNARQTLGPRPDLDGTIERLTKRWLTTFKAHIGVDFPIQ